MKHIKLLASLISLASCSVFAAPTIDTSPYRIAISFDGNVHDKDDFLAAPMSLAIIAEAGLKDRLVHVDTGNHLGNNKLSRSNLVFNNTKGAANRWNYSGTGFIKNDQGQLSQAVNGIKNAINASSASNPLYLVCAGPMEVPWRGINAANDSKREHCTAITHSPANNAHTDTSQLAHDWNDIRSTDVATVMIGNQNNTSWNKGKSKWNWLKNKGGKYKWLFNRNQKRRFDASDAGMVWYVITGQGQESPSIADIRSVLD